MVELKNLLVIRKLQAHYLQLKLRLFGEQKLESKRFLHYVGKEPNLKSPKTLNEKIAWLKINYYQPFFSKCSDKYLLHEYLNEKLGKDYAPELYYVTQNPKELNFSNITQFPCIIKVSNGSGANLIVKSKEQYTETYLQSYFERQLVLTKLHTVASLEHQYDTDKPYIVVERLLKDTNGGIPNDYKFLYMNGELQYIYCSVDRMGANVRQVYDKNWERLHFIWVEWANKTLFDKYEASASIPKPVNYDDMVKISAELAKDFPLVRIDFYETSDGIYIGEITLHHGSGHDRFYPEEYDLSYGSKLVLPEKNREDKHWF